MKFFKLAILISVILFLTCSCFDPPIQKKLTLSVPYHAQTKYNYCAIACIQMWADYKGACPSQEDISIAIPVSPYGLNPHEIVKGVKEYTNGYGFLARRDLGCEGARGDIMGAIYQGIRKNFPSIMFFFDGTHTVLAKGYGWHDSNGVPVIDSIYFHDPDEYYWGADYAITIADLKFYFTPGANEYYAVIAEEYLLFKGIQRHDEFVQAGGTYYGGPRYYNPKNIHMNINF